MWSIKGTPINITRPIIARYSFKRTLFTSLFGEKTIRVLNHDDSDFGVLLGLSTESTTSRNIPMVLTLPKEKLSEIHHEDILRILPDGEVQKSWDSASNHNVLYLTDRCNSSCVMCPQPPKSTGDYADEVLALLRLLKQSEVKSLCITGGEPTILQQKFIDILAACRKKFPHVPLLLLTNGRAFNDFSFVQATMKNAPADTMFAIPLYAPVASIHETIVGAKGAFEETIRGLHNLTRFGAKIEIRVVVSAMNYKLLDELANYIGWNLPMVAHVAFMGMEVHGMAELKMEKLWIEPSEYEGILQDAVRTIAYRDIPVSIYNLPHCLIPEGVRRFARKSISDWKQAYLSECADCTEKGNCAGFFTTSAQIPAGVSAFRSCVDN